MNTSGILIGDSSSMASTRAAIIVINPSHPWPRKRSKVSQMAAVAVCVFCFFPPQVITCSTGQSLPPTISSSRKKSCQTTVQRRFIFPCFTSIQFDTSSSVRQHRAKNINELLTVNQMLPSSIFASTQSGDSNRPLFKLTVVWNTSTAERVTM